jgi:hypothetical protein
MKKRQGAKALNGLYMWNGARKRPIDGFFFFSVFCSEGVSTVASLNRERQS